MIGAEGAYENQHKRQRYYTRKDCWRPGSLPKGLWVENQGSNHLNDGSGQTVEPLQDGHELTRDFSFWRSKEPVRKDPKNIPAPMSDQVSPVDPEDLISVRDMIALCERRARRILSGHEMTALVALKQQKMSRPMFEKALDQSMERAGRFNIHTLGRIIYQMQRGY